MFCPIGENLIWLKNNYNYKRSQYLEYNKILAFAWSSMADGCKVFKLLFL